MKNPTGEYRWKEYCPTCKRNHIFHMDLCNRCFTNCIPQPVSYDVCPRNYLCDGCAAYSEHQGV